eukprot:1359956-Amphidinium_carterae.1
MCSHCLTAAVTLKIQARFDNCMSEKRAPSHADVQSGDRLVCAPRRRHFDIQQATMEFDGVMVRGCVCVCVARNRVTSRAVGLLDGVTRIAEDLQDDRLAHITRVEMSDQRELNFHQM